MKREVKILDCPGGGTGTKVKSPVEGLVISVAELLEWVKEAREIPDTESEDDPLCKALDRRFEDGFSDGIRFFENKLKEKI